MSPRSPSVEDEQCAAAEVLMERQCVVSKTDGWGAQAARREAPHAARPPLEWTEHE